MKRIAVLGSTGSIGLSTLRVIREQRRSFRVVALSTNTRAELLRRQAAEYRPRFVCVRDARAAGRIRRALPRGVRLLVGEAGLSELLERAHIDVVLMAISGAAALRPFMQCIERGQDVALANKEALVMTGSLLMKRARRAGVNVLPVDSEQSAIWQCLCGEKRHSLRKVYLTASGGPLLRCGKRELRNISRERVLKHPRWSMGRKITVDSATMMNKGLEFIESMALFNLSAEQIQVVIHPEAIVHSMVEFCDGSIKAQLSQTDMRIPIQYALSYPGRLSSASRGVDLARIAALHFEKPDIRRFPCLGLAYEAARAQGTMPAVLNAANEIGVEAFLQGALSFSGIARVVEKVCRKHNNKRVSSVEDILEADSWARRCAGEYI